MDITKYDGTKQPFSAAKLCLSLRKAGAPRDVADSICQRVEKKITPHESSNTIFRKALKYLIREDIDVAARYSLRRGIEALGPAGFIFEHYFETVLQAYGFMTRRNIMMKGKCVTHEIDIEAISGSKHFLLEAKYHNQPGLKTHVNVVMYADARLQDIVANKKVTEKIKHEHAMWLVTNTKFTDTAITYARCKGIRLTGWNYPRGASLEDIIADKKLYPVTILPSLPSELLPKLAEKNIILAQDLLTFSAKDMVRIFNIGPELAELIISEVQGMTGNS